MDAIFQTDGSWAYVILRIGLAVTFFNHGTRQVLGWHGGRGAADTLKNWQEKYGLPKAVGIIGFIVELGGCLAMALGFLVRPAALGMVIFMAIVIERAHLKNGFFLNQGPGRGAGMEYCLALFLMALALLIGGGGALSVDGMLSR